MNCYKRMVLVVIIIANSFATEAVTLNLLYTHASINKQKALGNKSLNEAMSELSSSEQRACSLLSLGIMMSASANSDQISMSNIPNNIKINQVPIKYTLPNGDTFMVSYKDTTVIFESVYGLSKFTFNGPNSGGTINCRSKAIGDKLVIDNFMLMDIKS